MDVRSFFTKPEIENVECEITRPSPCCCMCQAQVEPNKYHKSYIYMINCKDPDVTGSYIGSTMNYKKRQANHKSACHREGNIHYDQKIYIYIRENGGWDNFQMVKLENVCCENFKELCVREGFWIKLMNPSLNTRIAGRTKAEYRCDNRNRMNTNQRKKYHTDKGREHKRLYYLSRKTYLQSKVECCYCKEMIQRTGLTKHQRSKTCRLTRIENELGFN